MTRYIGAVFVFLALGIDSVPTWKRIRRAAIMDANFLRTLSDVSVEDCKRECLQFTTCKSFNYYSLDGLGSCKLADVNAAAREHHTPGARNRLNVDYAPLDVTQLHCCQYNTQYGAIPHTTWGSTPEKEKKWYNDHNCRAAMGGAEIPNCSCRCTKQYNGQGVEVEAYCGDWDENKHWCYLNGGAAAKHCPGAKKSWKGDFYWTQNKEICKQAEDARTSYNPDYYYIETQNSGTRTIDCMVPTLHENDVTVTCDAKAVDNCRPFNECCGDQFKFSYNENAVTVTRLNGDGTHFNGGWGQYLRIRCDVIDVIDIYVGKSGDRGNDVQVTSDAKAVGNCRPLNECCGDKFKFSYNDNVITVTRLNGDGTHFNGGWGQDLTIRCDILEMAEDAHNGCRCTREDTYLSTDRSKMHGGAIAEAYCGDWGTVDKHWCYLNGGAAAKHCPGAKKSSLGDFYWTQDKEICQDAEDAKGQRRGACTGPDFEKASGLRCCEGLVQMEEERPLADPLYCDESNVGYGKTCFSTIVMCRPDYCLMEKSVDYSGNNIHLGGFGGAYVGHLRDAETCRTACEDTPGCKAWSFNKHEPNKDNCYLKNTLTLGLNRNLDDFFDSGILCRVKSFECLDLQIPTEDEIISQYCSPGLIDVLWSDKQSTEKVPITMTLTDSVTNTDTRSSLTAFTQENGWNFEKMDSSMHEWSDATETKVKDPETSQGITSPIGGFTFGTSCMNKFTELCTASGYTLGTIAQWFGAKDDVCKCKEVTKTHTDRFVVSKQEYRAESATWTCPEYSECVYTQYTQTALCSIPYWGTCTSVFEEVDPMGRNILKKVEIERNEKNKYLVTKSAEGSTKYVRTSGKMTDGKSCGVQLTPAVDNSSGAKFREWLTCPDPKDVKALPNCDCMLPRFKDCQTRTHPDAVLTQGDMCQLDNRPSLSDYDDVGACLNSRPTWKAVGNCFGADVYIVSGYNEEVYNELLKGIDGSSAAPKSKVAYDFDMVRDFSWTASHDTSDGYTHDGSVLLDGKDSTYWNVIGMPSWNNIWYVVFDANTETVVSQFGIMNYGDITHDAKHVLLQCSNDETVAAADVLGGAQFTLTTGHSKWQIFTNTNKIPCRYWKLSVTNMANQPWIRQVKFDFSNSGRRLQVAEDIAEEGHMVAPL